MAVIGLVLTCWGGRYWYLAGAAYWVPVYFIAALLGVLGSLPGGSRGWLAAGLLCILASAGLLAPGYFPPPNPAPAGQQPNFRILQFNTYKHRSNPDALIKLVRETSPDIILFQEFDKEWEAALKPLETLYPHHTGFPRYPGGGPDLGQYWRTDSSTPQVLAESGVPAVTTTLMINQRPVQIFNVHTAAPFSPRRARHHREQMHALALHLRGTSSPVIVVGDLNTTPWSQYYQELLRHSDLISARQGFGILGSWPSFFGLLRVPLDQVLVSAEINVIRCRVGPGLGSDHRPVLTDLYIPPLKNKD
ncbi:MAG TPA: endonuclease/exonuclease/phosphatase family protein [Candidatus Hydrogenedentes bacterium]|nr:endonuclease/exonuclease/phosphatase family protein [Candidatus Hydrogenedentota bacterium]